MSAQASPLSATGIRIVTVRHENSGDVHPSLVLYQGITPKEVESLLVAVMFASVKASSAPPPRIVGVRLLNGQVMTLEQLCAAAPLLTHNTLITLLTGSNVHAAPQPQPQPHPLSPLQSLSHSPMTLAELMSIVSPAPSSASHSAPPQMILLLLTAKPSFLCQSQSTLFHSLAASNHYRHVRFVEADIDIMTYPLPSPLLQPSAVPSLQMYFDGSALGQLTGPNSEQLQRCVESSEEMVAELADKYEQEIREREAAAAAAAAAAETDSTLAVAGSPADDDSNVDIDRLLLLSDDEAEALKRLVTASDSSVQSALAVFPQLRYVSDALQRLIQSSAERKHRRAMSQPHSAQSNHRRHSSQSSTHSQQFSMSSSSSSAAVDHRTRQSFDHVLTASLSRLVDRQILSGEEAYRLHELYSVQQQHEIITALAQYQYHHDPRILDKALSDISIQTASKQTEQSTMSSSSSAGNKKRIRLPSAPNTTSLHQQSAPPIHRPLRFSLPHVSNRADLAASGERLVEELSADGLLTQSESRRLSRLFHAQHSILLAAIIAFAQNGDTEDFIHTCKKLLALAEEEEVVLSPAPILKIHLSSAPESLSSAVQASNGTSNTANTNTSTATATSANNAATIPAPSVADKATLTHVLTLLPASTPLINLLHSLLKQNDAALINALTLYREKMGRSQTRSDSDSADRELRETVVTRVRQWDNDRAKKKRSNSKGLNAVEEVEEEEDADRRKHQQAAQQESANGDDDLDEAKASEMIQAAWASAAQTHSIHVTNGSKRRSPLNKANASNNGTNATDTSSTPPTTSTDAAADVRSTESSSETPSTPPQTLRILLTSESVPTQTLVDTTPTANSTQ